MNRPQTWSGQCGNESNVHPFGKLTQSTVFSLYYCDGQTVKLFISNEILQIPPEHLMLHDMNQVDLHEMFRCQPLYIVLEPKYFML